VVVHRDGTVGGNEALVGSGLLSQFEFQEGDVTKKIGRDKVFSSKGKKFANIRQGDKSVVLSMERIDRIRRASKELK
jgi:hypothetical protein